MAFRDRIVGLLGDPVFNAGIGLLSAPPGSTFGEALGHGVESANESQRAKVQQELIQQELKRRQAQAQAQQQLAGMLQQPQGLLGTISNKVQGLLGGIENVVSNPVVQGIAGAAAAGVNPLVGLLAAPGIRNDRERKVAENELLRQKVTSGRTRTLAQQRLQSMFGDQAPLAGLLAKADPQGFTQLLESRLFAPPPAETSLIKNLRAAGIDPASPEGQGIIRGKIGPQPSGFDQKLSSVTTALGRKLTDKEILGLAGGGTTVNVGTDANKPIPITQIGQVRLPDGSAVPIGTTPEQARKAGAKVFSAAELQSRDKLTTALGILTDLKKLAVDPKTGVFSDIPGNVVGRFAVGVTDSIGDLLGTDASDRRTIYRDLTRGTIAPLIRSLGESGSLATEDVTRALALLPDNGGLLPESGEIAKGKLEALQKILERSLAKSDAPQKTGNTVQLGNGVTLTFDE